MNICVFCSSSDNLAPEYLEGGYKIGQLMANAGHTLVFGGYTKGIMGAVATGVRDNGGNVISVIPAIFNGKRPNFETGAHVILTDTMSSRKNKMIELSGAFISLPGGIGTFDELFQMLAMNVAGETSKPIAILMQGKTQLVLRQLLETAEKEGLIRSKIDDIVGFCETPEAVLKYLEK